MKEGQVVRRTRSLAEPGKAARDQMDVVGGTDYAESGERRQDDGHEAGRQHLARAS